MKRDLSKRFTLFCVVVGFAAGFMSAFGLMIDTQHPPRHIWFALPWGVIVGLTVYAVCDVWGRMLLSDLLEPPAAPKRKRPLLKYISPEKQNR